MQYIPIKQPALCSKIMHSLVAFVLLSAFMVSCGVENNDDNAKWIDKCSVIVNWTVVNGDTVMVCDMSVVKEYRSVRSLIRWRSLRWTTAMKMRW